MKKENLENPVFQVETSSLMLCLHAFPCMQAYREKPSPTPSAVQAMT